LIHASAIIDADAFIADDVSIGPGTIIGAGVEIGAGSWIGPYTVIKGPTRIGRDNKIYQFCSIGDDPQDKKYDDDLQSCLEIGDGNTIREYVSINRGTENGGGVTRLGDDNWIMAYVHIAHDCMVGNHTIFANNATLAGHVSIEDYVILGGFTGVHQFCRVGAHSFSAISSVITKDVPPFVMVSENPARPHGLNSEGLKRRGFSTEQISGIKRAYKVVYKQSLLVKDALSGLEEMAQDCEHIARFMQFIRESDRGIVR
jgi:UDP-N-acetylglucosamine acyltransferase